MLSDSVVGEVTCVLSCLQLVGSGRRGDLVLPLLFPVQFLYLWFLWMAASALGADATSTDSQFYHTCGCLAQCGHAALLLPLPLILPLTKFVSGIHCLAFCLLSFSRSGSLSLSPSLTLSLVIFLHQLFYIYSASVCLCKCLSFVLNED